MKRKNGEAYIIKHGECIAHVTLENFSELVADRFNRELARQMMRQHKIATQTGQSA